MRYEMTAYENIGDTRMWDIKTGDPVREVKPDEGGRWVIDADTPGEALERLWEVGNRMDADAAYQIWPSDRRSMCMGDLAFVAGCTYVVEAVGWSKVGRDDHFPVQP